MTPLDHSRQRSREQITSYKHQKSNVGHAKETGNFSYSHFSFKFLEAEVWTLRPGKLLNLIKKKSSVGYRSFSSFCLPFPRSQQCHPSPVRGRATLYFPTSYLHFFQPGISAWRYSSDLTRERGNFKAGLHWKVWELWRPEQRSPASVLPIIHCAIGLFS